MSAYLITSNNMGFLRDKAVVEMNTKQVNDCENMTNWYFGPINVFSSNCEVHEVKAWTFSYLV